MKPSCHRCGHPVQHVGYFHEISGYEEVRASGGANKITKKKRTGRVLCAACMAVIRDDNPHRYGHQDSLI